MELKFEGAAALGGYVRAVFSRRARGHVLPLDLVAAQCRAAGRVARARLGKRLRNEMAGYLVSDCCADDAALRALEMAGAAAFSERRGKYAPGFNVFCAADSESLDAPECIAAGSCKARQRGVLQVGCRPSQSFLQRSALVSVAAFSGCRAWHEFGVDMVCISAGRVPFDVALDDCVTGGPLDAVEWIATGRGVWVGGRNGFVSPIAVRREGGAA